MNNYSIGPIELGATVIGGITEQNLVTGSEVKGEATSGEIYRRFQSLYAQKHAPGFTTYAIAAALDLCAGAGCDLSVSNLILYLQKHADGGTRPAGAAHRAYSFDRGILVPKQLSVDHQGDATISYVAIVTSSDGESAPITITDGVAMPAITDAERFTLWTAQIGGTVLTGKISLAIDFGINAVGESSDSHIYDTLASIEEIQPTITLSGIDPEWLKSTNIPILGKAGTHANTEIWLRKRAAGGTFVAEGVAEHIKFTAAGLAHIDDALSGSGNKAGASITMPLEYDGTNVPLVIDTTAAPA